MTLRPEIHIVRDERLERDLEADAAFWRGAAYLGWGLAALLGAAWALLG